MQSDFVKMRRASTCTRQQAGCVQSRMCVGHWRLRRCPLTLKSPRLPSAMQGRVTSWLRNLRAKTQELTGQTRSRARTTLHSLLVLGSLSSPWHLWLLLISAATWKVWAALDHRFEEVHSEICFLGSVRGLFVGVSKQKKRSSHMFCSLCSHCFAAWCVA